MDPVLTPMLTSAGVTGAITLIEATATTAAVTVSYASLLSYAITTAAVVGGSLALQSLTAQKAPKSNKEQFTSKSSISPRARGYGTAKLGGALFFLSDFSGTLFTGMVHCEGPIDSYREWWLNDKQTLPPAGSLGGQAGVVPWTIFVNMESHLGTDSQTASVALLTYFPGVWTSAHRLRGLAYTVLGCQVPVNPERNLKLVFPNGAPQLRVVARLAKVYDPRDLGQDPANSATWLWSDNAALCILDFLKSPRGFGLPLSRMNLDSFADFADVCDEDVNLKAGGSEKRYRIGGVYELTEEPRDVLRRMLATCDGELVPFPDGTVGIRGGKWNAPTVTIADAQVLGYEYQAGGGKQVTFNRLKLTYTSPAHDYQQTEGEAWEDVENQTLTGEVRSQDLSLPMVQSHAQARRLAKIAAHKGNPAHRLTNFTAQLPALDLLAERVVHVVLADLGITADFFITKFVPADDLTSVTMDLISLDATAYEWNHVTEEGTAPTVPGGVSQPVPPLPTDIGLLRLELQIDASTYVTRIRISAGPPSDGGPWVLIGRLRKLGETAADWIPVEDQDPADPLAVSVLTAVLAVNTTYEIQVAFSEPLGSIQSAWSASRFFTLNAPADRITEAGDVRITEAGDTHLLESAA